MSGREASTRIVTSLRSALLSGRSLTYVELAAEARCSTRTVRNYLEDARGLLGVGVRCDLGRDRTIRVTASSTTPSSSIEQMALGVARALLRGIFPIEGTKLDEATEASRAQVVLSVRGVYAYGESHMRVLRAWLREADRRPRRAVRFGYDAATGRRGDRDAWPLGIVVKDATRVYLAGTPTDAADGRDVRTFALEGVVLQKQGPTVRVLSAAESGAPPSNLEAAVIDEAIDSPFSITRPSPENAVHVRVRFSPIAARYIVGRRWHKAQRLRDLRGGGVELAFGPVDKVEAMNWIASWRDEATVVACSPITRQSAPRARRDR